MQYFKDFVSWIKYKIFLNNKSNLPRFNEAEVWWCSMGINIGKEIDGKSEKYNRPVLILRKFNREQFWGVPLTSKSKNNELFYHKVIIKDKDSFIHLTQIRTFDVRRLQDRITKVSATDLTQIKRKLVTLLKV
jgi:mRNA interferase MazF